MLNDPLPIMEKQRVLEIQEKPRLKFIKNQEEEINHRNIAPDKIPRVNSQNNNKYNSLTNFTQNNILKLSSFQKVHSNNKQITTSSNYKNKQFRTKIASRGGQQQEKLQLNQSVLLQEKQNQKTYSSNIQVSQEQELQWGEQDYLKDHDCILDSQSNRCKICNSVMKQIYFSRDFILQKPLSIYYADYNQIFSRKMECHSLSKFKQKQFLIINYLPYMKEWAYFILERQKNHGLEEFVYEDFTTQIIQDSLSVSSRSSNNSSFANQIENESGNKPNTSLLLSQVQQTYQQYQQRRLPLSLKLQFPEKKLNQENQNKNITLIQQQQLDQSQISEDMERVQTTSNSNFFSQKNNITFDFKTFTLLGNFESSNINFCTVDKKESKCQILLRSDTNTKGCLHWFMFTVKVNLNQLNKKCTNFTNSSINFGLTDEINDKYQCAEDDQELRKYDFINEDEVNTQKYKNHIKTINFSILNNKRNGFLYREGMQIAIFDSNKPEKGWHRGGDNIYYYRSNVDHQFFQTTGEYAKNQIKAAQICKNSQNLNENLQNCDIANSESNNAKNIQINSNNLQNTKSTPNLNSQIQQTLIQPQIQSNSKRGFQTLDFSYTFTEDTQRVTFAYCYPYTLSDQIQFLEQKEQKLIDSFPIYQNFDKEKQNCLIKTDTIMYKKKVIANSRLGLPIILLKITSSQNPKLNKNRKKKKIIFIISRQHPGETPSSFVCQGFIDFLLSDSIQSKFLLETYIFKIVPMMNPDGVVIGNSRCNISGADLNRKWDNPDPILHPEVFYVKNEIKKSHQNREVAIFCDIHGHSMKKHAFFYGCNKTSDGGASSWTQVRLIPRILARKSAIFNINDCKYRVTEDKKNTARVICWSELKISNSFTLETSFFGYDDIQNDNKPTHFTIHDFEILGKNLCESILEYTLIMEILTEELIYSNGWLKPYRLVQVTGESAQNQIIRNMKELKKFEKQQRIQNNISHLQQEKEKQQMLIQQQIYQREKRSQTPQTRNGDIRGKNMNDSYTQNEKRSKGNFSQDERLKRNDKFVEDDFNIDDNANNQNLNLILELCPDIKKDWRDYFVKDELERNFKKIEKGEDPNDQESESGSDSEAEIDIFKGDELQQSIEAKNRKKAKKKKQMKKEIINNAVTIDLKINNEVLVEQTASILQGTNTFQGPTKKKRKSTTNAQSLEKNHFSPSPMIQNYKQQLELKKQQLKKQSYPIAKVGQSFSSVYKNINTENTVYNAPAYSFSQSYNQVLSQQAKCQINQQQTHMFNSQQKNTVNGIYQEKKIEIQLKEQPQILQIQEQIQQQSSQQQLQTLQTQFQQKQLDQLQQFQTKALQAQSSLQEQNEKLQAQQTLQYQLQQQGILQQQQVQQKQQMMYYNQTNLSIPNPNTQNMKHQINNRFKQRKSVNSQMDERLSKFNSNSEDTCAIRLNTTEIQCKINDKLDQNHPNYNSQSRNYAKYLTSYNTQSSNQGQLTQQNIEIYQKCSQLSQSNQGDYNNQKNEKIYNGQNVEVNQQQEYQDQGIINENQFRRRTNSLFAMNSDSKTKNQKCLMVNEDNSQEISKQQCENNLSGEITVQYGQLQNDYSTKKATKQNKDQQSIIQNEANEFQCQPSQFISIKSGSKHFQKIQEIDPIDNLSQNQKINKNQSLYSASASGKKQSSKIAYDYLSDKKIKAGISEFNPNNNQIPHNFMKSASSNIELEPFYIQNTDKIDFSKNTKDNQQQIMNSRSLINNNADQLISNFNNLDQVAFPKDISKNMSVFDKKIRAQAPLRQINNPEKMNQIFPQTNLSNNTLMIHLNAHINDNLNSIYQRKPDKLNDVSFNSMIGNSGFGQFDKNTNRKIRTRSIQEGKAQSLNQSIMYGTTFNKLNTSTDQQQSQMYPQQNGSIITPIKNLSSYVKQPQIFQNNNIRIRKLNLQ